MKPLSLSDLGDVSALSTALHQVLKALYHSPLRLKPAFLCRLLKLHHSELARMRWAHCRPRYLPLVSRARIRRVLEYLLGQFPTLVIGTTRSGEIVAHLYKYYRGKRLRRTLKRLQVPRTASRRQYASGSTRWFLQLEGFSPVLMNSSSLRRSKRSA